jgi:D-3-phosphoglycerate dehydrogenase / 2-oxoglutarate reductase
MVKSPTSFPKEKIKILLLENIHPGAVEEFRKAGYTQTEALSKALTEKELIAKIKDVHVLGIRSKTNVTAEVFENAERLHAIGCFCIGVNQVNMDAATRRGVAVFNSPFSNTRSVAELVISHAIALLRRIPEKNAAAHLGKWMKDSRNCFEIRGKTIGIAGYGHIGSQVSVLAEALGLNVLYYDTEPKLALGKATPVKSFEDLLKSSDIITLHVPGTARTKNLINADNLRKVKKGAVLLNLSRGDVMDQEAARDAFLDGRLNGIAADVFPEEPESDKDPFTSPLQNLPNVILTPHIGGSTVEAQENIGLDVASKLISFMDTGATVGSHSIPSLNLPVQERTYRVLHIHENVPGVLSEINSILSKENVNILGQYLQTNAHIGYVVVDFDRRTSPSVLLEKLRKVKHTIRTRNLY